MLRSVKVVILLLSLLLSNVIQASDVIVDADFSTRRGVGLLRPVGDECFVYTPNHVVDKTETILVSSRLYKDVSASFLTSYPIDLAILQVDKTSKNFCRDTSWVDDGGRVNTLLNNVGEVDLLIKTGSGNISVYQSKIVKKDLHSYFYIKPLDEGKKIYQGMSGSLVKVADYPIGMLISVKEGVGKVLRMDTIADSTRSLMASYGDARIANAPIKSNVTMLTGRDLEHNSAKNSIYGYKGRVSKGKVNTYPIHTSGNTAYRVTFPKGKESFWYTIGLDSPNGKNIDRFYNKSNQSTRVFGFGTVDEGTHVLWVRGEGREGQYEIKVEEVATTEQLVGSANVLAHGDSVKGFLAKNTYAKYKVYTKGNTAFRVTLPKQSQAIRYSLGLNSPNGINIDRFYNTSNEKTRVFGFGTIDEGEHSLWIRGEGRVGKYEIMFEEVATTEQLVGSANVLAHGDSVKGFLAKNTYAEYKISMKGNAAFRVTLPRQSQAIRYSIGLNSPEGNNIKRFYNKSNEDTKSYNFYAEDEGEYKLWIKGEGWVGKYTIDFSEIKN